MDKSIFLGEKDWVYAMRREMQEIIVGLFLGPYASVTKAKLNELIQKNITHVICVRHQFESHFIRANFPDKFRYFFAEIADNEDEDIIQSYFSVKPFLQECLSNGGKLIVHGNAGISRSASLVIAYLMEQYNLSFNAAFNYVRKRRFCVQPNLGFIQQLKNFESLCVGNTDEIAEPNEGSLKRKRGDSFSYNSREHSKQTH